MFGVFIGGNMNINEILEQHKIWLESYGQKGSKANLSGADLRGANLKCADLIYANLSGADLSHADLRGANLKCADLIYANLSGADLSYANLSGADLSHADLRGANLKCADLSYANLSGADLRGANLPEQTFIIAGEKYCILITNGEFLRAGCQSHPIESWRKFTKHEIAEMDGKNALRFYPRLLDIIDFYCGKGERPNWVKEESSDEPHTY